MSEEFSDEINERLGELETIIQLKKIQLMSMRQDVRGILSSLGLNEYDKLPSEIETSEKFKVLLAQFFFLDQMCFF